ncbi:MAG: hypothetical protein GXZ08_09230 [Tissierellia bacterium]|nr:hypothetical protein [Tissierellia bacterium]
MKNKKTIFVILAVAIVIIVAITMTMNKQDKNVKLMSYDEVFIDMIENGISEAEARTSLLYDVADEAEAKNANYNVIVETLDINDDYKPTLKFYFEVGRGAENEYIERLITVAFNPKDKDIEKSLNGLIYSDLLNSNEIYYTVVGDFYTSEDENTRYFSPRELYGKGVNINYQATNTQEHYADVNASGVCSFKEFK